MLLRLPRQHLLQFRVSSHVVCTYCSRTHVRYVDPSSVRWFPGHMRKGINAMNSKMSNVDVLIEVHDARIPFTGRSELFQKFGQIRPHILLLNKVDLAEEVTDVNAFRAEIFRHSMTLNHNLAEIYFTQLNSPERQKHLLRRVLRSLPKLAQTVAIPTMCSNEFDGKQSLESAESPSQSTISAMAVGIPNSGKSTLINALRFVGRGGPGGAARVGRMAGQTRSVGQPVVISRGALGTVSNRLEWLDNSVQSSDFRIVMLDTPGILEPKIRSLSEQLSLCVCGAVDWDLVSHELLVDYLLFWWNHRKRTEYVSVLELPGPTDNIVELLSRVCARNSFFASGSRSQRPVSRSRWWEARELESLDDLNMRSASTPRPDFGRAAYHILRLFNKGAFGRTTFLPSDEVAAAKFFVPATRKPLDT
ncbi:Mitochondrial GTPase [Clonorchis sinensis]|uniref:Mitochondrial GTPase n=2 Tax=Clonorchis sinensis TaxID=79923 RepID=A0A419PN38_CLOSI|nr:Mitochondrial GTPase [Clonorchis sinensis]